MRDLRDAGIGVFRLLVLGISSAALLRRLFFGVPALAAMLLGEAVEASVWKLELLNPRTRRCAGGHRPHVKPDPPRSGPLFVLVQVSQHREGGVKAATGDLRDFIDHD